MSLLTTSYVFGLELVVNSRLRYGNYRTKLFVIIVGKYAIVFKLCLGKVLELFI